MKGIRVFISFASEDRRAAEDIHFALTGAGFETFYDKDSLPAGEDFNARIRAGFEESDLLVFLVSPDSVRQGSYALTELRYARMKWPHPKGRVLPVMVREAPWAELPSYLSSVTVLEPEGNVAAEVTLALTALAGRIKPRMTPKVRSIAAAAVILAVLGAAIYVGTGQPIKGKGGNPDRQPRASALHAGNLLFVDTLDKRLLQWSSTLNRVVGSVKLPDGYTFLHDLSSLLVRESDHRIILNVVKDNAAHTRAVLYLEPDGSLIREIGISPELYDSGLWRSRPDLRHLQQLAFDYYDTTGNTVLAAHGAHGSVLEINLETGAVERRFAFSLDRFMGSCRDETAEQVASKLPNFIGLATDSMGDVFLTEYWTAQLVKVTRDNRLQMVCLPDKLPGNGIAVDLSTGAVYVGRSERNGVLAYTNGLRYQREIEHSYFCGPAFVSTPAQGGALIVTNVWQCAQQQRQQHSGLLMRVALSEDGEVGQVKRWFVRDEPINTTPYVIPALRGSGE